jgi:hypothetical protein
MVESNLPVLKYLEMLNNSQMVLGYITSGEAYLLAEYPSRKGPEGEKGIGRLGITV